MPSRKISRGPPELLNTIFEVADRFHIKDVNCHIAFGYDELDDYQNELYSVCVRGVRDGQKVKKSFVVKWHSDVEKRNAYRKAYQRDCFFLCHIAPKLLELQNTFKIIEGLKLKFVNCCLAVAERQKQIIVLADITRQGFIFHDRFQKLDLDHVTLAIKTLAKLHALSFVLEKCQPEDFKNIKETCSSDVQYSDTERMSKELIRYYNTSVNVVSDLASKQKLRNCASDVLKILNRCVMPDTPYRTICHGDYWNGNVLYKYYKNKPVETMFIDTQLARYASPVTDISYYLYMSTDHEFRSQHYDRVLSLYYVTLSAVLRQCNLDIADIYPESTFRLHLKKYSVFGLIEALISMKIITAVSEETIEMAEGWEKSWVVESQNCSVFVERVNAVVNDFFNRGYSLNGVLGELQE